MKKLPEQENKLKRTIRDIIALDPLASTERIASLLFDKGYKTSNNKPLDWHYVHKIRNKIHRQGLADLGQTEVKERINETKERYRILSDRLTRIAYGTDDLQKESLSKPNFRDQISAINSIMKHDLALLNAELDTGVLKENKNSNGADNPRNQPINAEQRASIFEAVRKRFKSHDGNN